MRLLLRFIGICAAVVLALPFTPVFASQPPILADFDDGYPSAFVGFNNVEDVVALELLSPATEDEVDSRPGQGDQNQVLKISYNVQNFGGIVQPYFGTSKDWSAYAGVGFWFYGQGTGQQYQFEIYENRTDLDADPKTGERFEVRFDDSVVGWRELSFSFDDFRRSTDFQEADAPDDGFTLEAVSGYSIVLPLGTESTAYVDDIQLLVNDPIANFEDGLALGMFVFPGSDPINVVTQTVGTVNVDDALAVPGQAGENHILEVPYSIEQFGGFTYTFDPAPRDWSDFAGISFWFYGEGSNNRYQVEIFDNRSDSESDTAERFEYRLADDFTGWRFFQIPFADFVRAEDYQPEGAPNDGFGLTEVWGYSITLPLGVGTLRLDDLTLYNFVSTPNSRIVTDYEDGIPSGFFPFKGEASSIISEVVTIGATDPISLPNQLGPDKVFKVSYSNADFAGFSQISAAPESWIGNTGIQFWFYGTGANVSYEFEILTNRSDPSFDTSERYETTFFDAEPGWRLVELSFSDFERAGFQPQGAPDDGFALTEVWGYAMTLPQTDPGSEVTFHINDVELIRSVEIANYEDVALGSIFAFSGISSTVTSTVVSVDSGDLFAFPGAEATNDVLEIQYKVKDFGGVTTSFDPFPKNWSDFMGISFWMFGSNSQRRFQFEIQDKRADRTTESSEVYEYVLTDDFTGWQEIELLFGSFGRARDFQFEAAPDDGFTTDEIWAYSITLPTGEGVLYLDNFALLRQPGGLPPALYMPVISQ